MCISNWRRLLSLSLSCIVVVLVPPAPGLVQAREKPVRTEKVTLQYRVARDAFAPSRFVAVIDDGISLPLELNWDLPKLEDPDKREAQAKQKTEFDNLIKKLEAREINGVEFECTGEWLTKGRKLRITSVPQLTDAGRKRIRDSEERKRGL
jgi:hypothetical protein